ncbi:cytidylyltransferase domain-containing protein [Idiomarina abyssalis]|uniref:cytidylyltransferase domain-containing protein n=1 Tax=Idiomarina abyssalis TaxID=86102 RepID=UPI003A9285C1
MSVTVAIIPARGGSKGIPRKNLRPLAGKPMIFYAIDACKKAKGIDEVIVSTDDDEIALFAERFGARVLMRDPKLADDKTTLDPVVLSTTEQLENILGYKVDTVITVQPTSPLIRASDLKSCVEIFEHKPEIDTVLSVVDDRHLCWTIKDNNPIPLYQARVNRQQLAPNFRETGAIIACRREVLESGSRIGKSIELLEMPQQRSFDIDNISDLYLCEGILTRKKIVFSVVGYPEVGLGHAFRAVMLANEFVHHELIFVCEEESSLAAKYIQSHNYTVIQCENGLLAETILDLSPDVVINDILDTTSNFVRKLKSCIPVVVNFEDLGSGMKEADLVINALYPNPLPYKHVKVGHEFFCLRDEFIFTETCEVGESVNEILITFGGVDEGNLTKRVCDLLADYLVENQIKAKVVTGPGYRHKGSLTELARHPSIEVIPATNRISDYMLNADLAITSGGRTVLELTALQIPTVVICQNERETTHTFASSANGVVNLGFRGSIDDQTIIETLTTVIESKELRTTMRNKMKALDLSAGKKRVCELIKNLFN